MHKLINVWGRLYFDDSGVETVARGNFSLHSINIVIRGTGQLNATCTQSNDQTSAHHCEIVLHGDRTTPGIKVGNKDYGAKGIIVLGEFNLMGRSRGVSWTKLAAGASVGDTQIAVQVRNDEGDWRAGDRVILPTTSFDPSHAEYATIVSVAGQGGSGSTRTLTLAAPLNYRHRCDRALMPAGQSKSMDICGEVGLLSRNVVVRGGDTKDSGQFHSLFEHEFGATITVAKHSIRVAGQTQQEVGA